MTPESAARVGALVRDALRSGVPTARVQAALEPVFGRTSPLHQALKRPGIPDRVLRDSVGACTLKASYTIDSAVKEIEAKLREQRPPPAPPSQMTPESAAHVGALVSDALRSGVPAASVQAALESVFGRTSPLQQMLERPGIPDTRELSDSTALCTLSRSYTIRSAVQTIKAKLKEQRSRMTAVDVSTDDGVTHTWWSHPPVERESKDRGHVRLVAVYGVQVGDNTRQLNVVTQTIDNPVLNLETLTRDPAITATLAALRAQPNNPELHAAAVNALSAQADNRGDWATAYERTGTATTGDGSAALDGTVAVVRSRAVKVGDRTYQENQIVHTVSPEVPAEQLMHHPELLDALVDVVAAGGRGATQRFTAVLGTAMRSDLAAAPAAQRGYSTVYKPPEAGRTLQLRHSIGVAVGKRASSKARFAQQAHVGRRAGSAVHRMTNQVGRAPGP